MYLTRVYSPGANNPKGLGASKAVQDAANPANTIISLNGQCHRRIADVCFELHFRVTPGQFRSAAASSLHRRLALLATSAWPSFSKNAYLGILFAPMYQKYSLDFVSFGFYSNIQIV